MAMRFETKQISAEPDAIGPDGSEVPWRERWVIS
jgi:hypothetical protein